MTEASRSTTHFRFGQYRVQAPGTGYAASTQALTPLVGLKASLQVGHGDVPVAEVAADVPGGGSGAAAMALAVRSHHSAITAFSSAGYAASTQALTPLVGGLRPVSLPSLNGLWFRSRYRKSGFSWWGLLSGLGLWRCAPVLRPGHDLRVAHSSLFSSEIATAKPTKESPER